MSAPLNPYTRPAPVSDGSAPDPSGEYVWGGPGRYAVRDIPESTDPEYTTGFAPSLAATGSPNGTMLPDDIRVGLREAPPNDPNRTDVNTRRYSEFHQRHSVEKTTVGWKVQQHKTPVPHYPEWDQDPMPTRPTADASPTGYQFQRPEHHPRNIKDALGEDAVAHFSLADHRRQFEIMGQKPQGGIGANTYRAPVRPWDESLFIPPQPANVTNSFVGNRNYRLG
jgi:hypothetical protein